ncbi:MAG: type III pantothenate kinase [Chitinispirillia bacterium]|nr:type III pantothenate kinase [Chitinispirillia bacterium]MCL2242011.1 type III pantothenate kinase [Chitinispirillia bacterium]
MNNVLSIDIGSTRTHLAAVDVDTLSSACRIGFDNTDFNARFLPSIKNIISGCQHIAKVNITSCVKILAVKAKDLCGSFDDVNIIRHHDNLPISVNYENPQTLGTDRLCNALACASMFNGQNCIIIDSGTAITIDYLRGGKTFEGGAILPGCATQARALHRQTDALPSVNLRGIDDDTVSIPATSTEKCINAGILLGTAGAVERCICEYLRINGSKGNNDTVIAATGGGWEIIRPLVNINHHTIKTIPDLTLIGAALYI